MKTSKILLTVALSTVVFSASATTTLPIKTHKTWTCTANYDGGPEGGYSSEARLSLIAQGRALRTCNNKLLEQKKCGIMVGSCHQ